MRTMLPILGQQRIRSGFLFTPLEIGHESRWLEYATWIEQYRNPVFRGEKWEPVKFINKNEINEVEHKIKINNDFLFKGKGY